MASRALSKAELTRRDVFAMEYVLNGGNGTEAYMAVYPKAKRTSAAANAHKLLRIAEVQDKVRRLRTANHDLAMVTYEETLQEIGKLAMFDPAEMFDEDGRLLPLTEMPEAARKMVHEVEFTLQDYDEDYVRRMVKVKYGKDKAKYLDMLMKHYGGYEAHQRQGATQIAVIQYTESDARL